MDNLILRENGETHGADPRHLSVDTLNAAGHEKAPLLRVIRAFCLECSGGVEPEVRKCTAIKCLLWPYRMNKNPFSGHKGNVAHLRGITNG